MNKVISLLRYQFYLKELLVLVCCYFITEGIFSWLLIPNSAITAMYTKFLSMGVFAFMVLSFRNLESDEKLVVVLFSLLVLKLLFESLIVFESFFKQFAIYSVIFPVLFAVFIKYVFRTFDLDILEFIAKFYLLTYLIFMVIYGRQFSFGLEAIEMDDYGPFSGDGRIIHARSIFMIIIPFLWYFNRFVHKPDVYSFILLLFSCVIITIHQHRSVWSSALFALLIYFCLTLRKNIAAFSRFAKMIGVTVAISLLAYFYFSNLYPEASAFFADRFNEIWNPAKEGSTGNFRIEQTAVYIDLIKQKPILGWSFAGFYLQNPLVDWWEENTGHHFHEGYLEILYYHGIVGLLLKYGFLILILIKAFTTRLSQEAVVLVAFCLSGLVFSLSYVPPLIFWGHIGVCLYYLNKRESHGVHRNAGL